MPHNAHITPQTLNVTIPSCAVLSRAVVSDTLWPHGLQPTRLLCACGFPGRNTGVGCHSLFQGIFPTQGSNPLLPHWQADSLPLSHQGSSWGHRPPPQRHPLFVGYASQRFQMLVMRQWRVPPHTVAEQSHILGGRCWVERPLPVTLAASRDRADSRFPEKRPKTLAPYKENIKTENPSPTILSWEFPK